MADAVEVVVRLGDSVLDVQYVTCGYRLAGEELAIPPLELGERVAMRRGLVDIAITCVERPRRSIPLAPHGDRRALSYVAVSLAVHLVVWAVAPPPDPEPIIARVPRPPMHVISIPRSPPLLMLARGGGSPAIDVAGTAGGDSPDLHGRMQIARRQDEPQLARASATVRVGEAGILGSRELAKGFDAIVGRADLSSGFGRNDLRGSLNGGEGAGAGDFGMGRSGSGPGGGCEGGPCNGIIGSGRYGTASEGRGTGTGYGAAGGRGGLQARTASVPTVRLCAGPRPCVVTGGLDKAIIRRYIRRNLAKITYCYEKELLAMAELSGVIETDFLIGQDGIVQMASARGVSTTASDCIAGVLRAIEFPRSLDGATRVTYPFTFRLAGS